MKALFACLFMLTCVASVEACGRRGSRSCQATVAVGCGVQCHSKVTQVVVVQPQWRQVVPQQVVPQQVAPKQVVPGKAVVPHKTQPSSMQTSWSIPQDNQIINGQIVHEQAIPISIQPQIIQPQIIQGHQQFHSEQIIIQDGNQQQFNLPMNVTPIIASQPQQLDNNFIPPIR